MSKQSGVSPRTVFVNSLLMTQQMKINPILNQQKTPISKSWRFYYLFGNSNMLCLLQLYRNTLAVSTLWLMIHTPLIMWSSFVVKAILRGWPLCGLFRGRTLPTPISISHTFMTWNEPLVMRTEKWGHDLMSAFSSPFRALGKRIKAVSKWPSRPK